MTEEPTIIQLSEDTVQELIYLCRIVKNRNSDNEQTCSMASGISEWMCERAYVTPRQAD